MLSDLGEIPGCLVEHLYLVLCEGVDGEVGVDEHGHPHNHHQVHVQNNLEKKYTFSINTTCQRKKYKFFLSAVFPFSISHVLIVFTFLNSDDIHI